MTALEQVADAAVARNQENEALIKELVEALKEVWQWISAWDPSFIQDDEWPDTAATVEAVLAKAEARNAL